MTVSTDTTLDSSVAIPSGFPGEQATPETILGWAAAAFPGRIAVSCSFGGAGGMVLAHMLTRFAPTIPLLFIDTHYLFPETYQLRRLLELEYGLRIIDIEPTPDAIAQCARHSERLWESDPDLCCRLRKVNPMQRALAGLDAWVTSLRRDQSPQRAGVKVLEIHHLGERRLIKLNPLAYWSKAQVWDYITEHSVPYNPLLNKGYTSIGCIHCTQPSNSSDERAGRWAGRDKTECGLHTFTQAVDVCARY